MLALLLLLAGDRIQWSVVRALRATVLLPATAIDNTLRDVMKVRAENATLRRDLARARMQIAASARVSPEPAAVPGWTPARVVGRGQSAGGNWNYLTVRPGHDAADTSAPTVALTPEGLVGAVVESGWGTVTVRAITAPESSVHVVDQRSRVAGVLRPEADVGTGLRLRLVPTQEDVAVGDTLVTSGFGRLFPPDIPVGRVTRVETAEGSLVRDVWVTSFVPFARIEHVFLISRRPPW